MPTNQNSYNTRLTDEALEKRFRDTFRSQGGAELVDDLYASGVIVPVVDFTQAAEGSQLPVELQQAWDFSTGAVQISNTTSTIVGTSGFWKIDLIFTGDIETATAPSPRIEIFDGSTTKPIWGIPTTSTPGDTFIAALEAKFVVFLRPGDNLQGLTSRTDQIIDVWYRQIADVNGNLVNPTGFTSS